MARYVRRSRARRIMLMWWYGLRKSPPALIAIVFHLLLAIILMNVYISQAQTDLVMKVDVSKMLEKKFDKKIDSIVEAPLTKTDAKPVVPDILVPQLPLDRMTDTKRAMIPHDVIASRGKGGFGVGSLGEGGLKGFVGEVRGLRRGGLDVVFVIDTTETMRGVIEEVKQRIRAIIRVLDALVGNRCRVGVVCYRDKAAEYDTKPLDLTNDRQKVYDFIRKIDVGHGCKTKEELEQFKADKGIPANEDVYSGMREANKFSWRSDAKKVIVLIGDAPPHREDVQKVFGLAASFRARGNAVLHTISSMPPIYLEGLTGTLREQSQKAQEKDREAFFETFKTIAQKGGGQSVGIEKDKAIVKQLLTFAFGPQWKGNIEEIYATLGLAAAAPAKEGK